ncbi:putative component of membrane protein insertase Oxa1/YidC/SpoIIIJ protein YidD [Streptomyces sp. HB372]|nr:putative component of membrane protein insertase Oxa1/YidC/SpoIIIJ protein YidD [Streptomyces sp. HB372]
MKYPLLALIKLYQWTISPLLGPVCRYYPSCSHYGYTSIDRHGAIKGTALTALAHPAVQSVVTRRCGSCPATQASAVARAAA